jgi:hypothetical protein
MRPARVNSPWCALTHVQAVIVAVAPCGDRARPLQQATAAVPTPSQRGVTAWVRRRSQRSPKRSPG